MIHFSKSILTLFVASLTVASALGQELHIYYNLYNDEVKYEENGKPVALPNLRQGDEIVLHLTEFNNYLYTIELEVSQNIIAETSSTVNDASLMSSMMPGSMLPIPGFTGSEDGVAGAPGVFDIPLLTINDNAISLASLFGGRGSAALLEEMDRNSASISNILTEMGKVASKIKDMRRTALVSRMAVEYIDVLKNHPNLHPSFIKSMCSQYYEAIFRKDPSGDIELNDVLALQDDANKYSSHLSELKVLNKALGARVKTLDSQKKRFRAANVEETAAYNNYSSQLAGFLQKSKSLNHQLESAVLDSNATVHYPSPMELTNLQLQLAEVINNDFTYHSRHLVSGDNMDINIKVVKISGQANGDNEVVKSRRLHYKAKGGLKITGSVGLNFSQYFDPAQNYSVNNGLIVGEDGGAFLPTVTSFIHFYSYSGKKVSLGGSFGIGFPLTGTNDNQSLQFFVGPSIIFGTSQRMVLNFGLTGGRVTRLARGFEVGDEFDVNLGDIPTSSPYELGLFIGASFNLGGN